MQVLGALHKELDKIRTKGITSFKTNSLIGKVPTSRFVHPRPLKACRTLILSRGLISVTFPGVGTWERAAEGSWEGRRSLEELADWSGVDRVAAED